MTDIDVFTSKAGGFNTFRIPALAVAGDGTLLAFAEGRKGGGDPGTPGHELHLVLKRSMDRGDTWSDMTTVEKPEKEWSAGNPCPIYDRDTGRIWLHYILCRPGCKSNTSRPGTDDLVNLVRFSDDAGTTWSDPEDITASCRDMSSTTWRSTIMGPGGAIQDRNGRLVVPCWKWDEPLGVFAVFSDDHGTTWRRGKCVPDTGTHANEDQLVELADGRLLLDFRQADSSNSELPHRGFAESIDGGRTWSQPRPGLPVKPVCCAIERFSLKSEGADADRIIWTGPRGPGRRDLVMRVSEDEGLSFPYEQLIYSGPAAYSDMARLPDGGVGVLWERGAQREGGKYDFLTFTKIPQLPWV